MRRHDLLIPYSHDHHHALAQARRLKKDASAGDDVRIARAREFIDFFETDSVEHFRKEEEELFPAAGDEDAELNTLIEQILDEHVAIRALVDALRQAVDDGAIPGRLLERLGTALQDHIRLEEKKVFPRLEAVIRRR